MSLPIKHLKNILLGADKFLLEPNSENWQAFVSAFEEAETLDKRISDHITVTLARDTSGLNYRDDDPLFSNKSSEWVFKSEAEKIKVVLEIERHLGKFVITGQIIPENDLDLSEKWAGAQLEISQQGKVIAIAEFDVEGEFETQIDTGGSTDFTIIALHGAVLVMNDVMII